MFSFQIRANAIIKQIKNENNSEKLSALISCHYSQKHNLTDMKELLINEIKSDMYSFKKEKVSNKKHQLKNKIDRMYFKIVNAQSSLSIDIFKYMLLFLTPQNWLSNIRNVNQTCNTICLSFINKCIFKIVFNEQFKSSIPVIMIKNLNDNMTIADSIICKIPFDTCFEINKPLISSIFAASTVEFKDLHHVQANQLIIAKKKTFFLDLCNHIIFNYCSFDCILFILKHFNDSSNLLKHNTHQLSIKHFNFDFTIGGKFFFFPYCFCTFCILRKK